MKDHPHPGKILHEMVFAPLALETEQIAEHLHLPREYISRIISGDTGITPDLAIRLELAGVSTASYWLTLQSNYELSEARKREQPNIVPFSSSELF